LVRQRSSGGGTRSSSWQRRRSLDRAHCVTAKSRWYGWRYSFWPRCAAHFFRSRTAHSHLSGCSRFWPRHPLRGWDRLSYSFLHGPVSISTGRPTGRSIPGCSQWPTPCHKRSRCFSLFLRFDAGLREIFSTLTALAD